MLNDPLNKPSYFLFQDSTSKMSYGSERIIIIIIVIIIIITRIIK